MLRDRKISHFLLKLLEFKVVDLIHVDLMRKYFWGLGRGNGGQQKSATSGEQSTGAGVSIAIYTPLTYLGLKYVLAARLQFCFIPAVQFHLMIPLAYKQTGTKLFLYLVKTVCAALIKKMKKIK